MDTEVIVDDQGDSPRDDGDDSVDLPREPRHQGSLSRPESRRIYLETLAETGNLAASARAIGITRRAVLYRRKSEPEFDQLVEQALENYQAKIHAEIRRRAIEGVEQPVYQGGVLVGHTIKYSDRLLEMEARRVMPEYREAMAGAGGAKITNNIAVSATSQAASAGATPQNPMALDVSRMTKAQREAYRAFLATMAPGPTDTLHELAGAPPREDQLLDVESSEAIQGPPSEAAGDSEP